MGQSPHVLILAAGKGTRMRSKQPKVLHPVLFRPMLHYVLDLARALPHQSISVIVGHGEKEVRESCSAYEGIQYFLQKEQKGTADAVRSAQSHLAAQSGQVLILSGDVILLRPATLETFLQNTAETGATAGFITTQLPEPKGLGRVLRDSRGSVRGIREEADCSPAERALTEINAGIYCIQIPALFRTLAKISPRNRQGEYYLTDVMEILVAEGEKVEAFRVPDSSETLGINDRVELARAEAVWQERINREWMIRGVTLVQPGSTFIDPTTRLGADVRIEAGCHLLGAELEDDVTVESGSRIVSSHVGRGTRIKQGSYIEKSSIGAECAIGPYAHLRLESQLGKGVKLGNFVETKKARFGDGSKASHLSYIGDAEVGANVNLGCGFITCNYDGGPQKHQTVIEDGVFVGSDTQVGAPVRIGAGAYIASGSTITKNVPADALAISRTRQENKLGYAVKLRPSLKPKS